MLLSQIIILCFFSCSVDISIMNNDENVKRLSSDTPNNRHNRVRDKAEADYLKSIAKRQKLYDNAVKQQEDNVEDLVGLQIERVDRTHTTPKILPCKVVSFHSSSNGCVMYNLCTMKCLLSILYHVQDLLDLRKCDFTDLRSVDPTNLPIMAFTQTCKEYVSAGTNSVVEACNCSGKCATKSCPCKARDTQCCSKCHPKKKSMYKYLITFPDISINQFNLSYCYNFSLEYKVLASCNFERWIGSCHWNKYLWVQIKIYLLMPGQFKILL